MQNNLFIENSTIRDVFNISLNRFKNKAFLESPRTKLNDSFNTYSFSDVYAYIKLFTSHFKDVCINPGDRVAVLIGNIPEFFILKIALNYNGISCVPLNYELTNSELNYIVKHSKSSHIICKNFFLKKTIKFIDNYKIGISIFNENNLSIFKSIKTNRKTEKSKIKPSNEASLIYTSGTTGKPKGCMLSHFYEINAGYSYILKKGLISIRVTGEKIYNCLPVHHVNAGILSFYAALLTGNCQIQSSRFSVTNFWKEIKYSNATIFHYLGVMAPLLLKQKRSIEEKNNNLRLGIGAGIEPNFHSIFEKRFNIPMIELWGMTEMVRCIFDFKKKYRKVGKRCFGKPDSSLETIVINSLGKSVINEEGELLIRHNKENPKKGFFDGYYKNSIATKKAWSKNWFHTGDIVIKDKNGYLFFIDRKKNIIRRSGENIAAIEVEASLLSLTDIKNAAVCAYPHKIYEEEVLAFIILKDNKKQGLRCAKNIINKLKKNLAYYKLPAYIKFTDNLPITSSQKVVKKDLLKQIKNGNSNDFYDLSEFKRSLNN